MPILRSLAAWEMSVLMPQKHLGGRAQRCTGWDPTGVLQTAAEKGFCLQAPTGWGGREGLRGTAGSLGGLSGARGQESELGGRLMIEGKSENMSR